MERLQSGSQPSLIQPHQTPPNRTPFLGSAIPTNPFPQASQSFQSTIQQFSSIHNIPNHFAMGGQNERQCVLENISPLLPQHSVNQKVTLSIQRWQCQQSTQGISPTYISYNGRIVIRTSNVYAAHWLHYVHTSPNANAAYVILHILSQNSHRSCLKEDIPILYGEEKIPVKVPLIFLIWYTFPLSDESLTLRDKHCG